jgi:hypothetical protein
MTPQDEERLWRNRFITINLVRIGATAIVLFGLLVAYTDLVVDGGSILVGLGIALAALVVSFWGPVYLTRKWRTPPDR